MGGLGDQIGSAGLGWPSLSIASRRMRRAGGCRDARKVNAGRAAGAGRGAQRAGEELAQGGGDGGTQAEGTACRPLTGVGDKPTPTPTRDTAGRRGARDRRPRTRKRGNPRWTSSCRLPCGGPRPAPRPFSPSPCGEEISPTPKSVQPPPRDPKAWRASALSASAHISWIGGGRQMACYSLKAQLNRLHLGKALGSAVQNESCVLHYC